MTPHIWLNVEALLCYAQEHYLPYLVRSKLKLASVGVSDTAFDSFLESSLQEESKRVVLEVGKGWLTHIATLSTLLDSPMFISAPFQCSVVALCCSAHG